MSLLSDTFQISDDFLIFLVYNLINNSLLKFHMFSAALNNYGAFITFNLQDLQVSKH